MDTSNSLFFLPHVKKNISVTFLLFHDIAKLFGCLQYYYITIYNIGVEIYSFT